MKKYFKLSFIGIVVMGLLNSAEACPERSRRACSISDTLSNGACPVKYTFLFHGARVVRGNDFKQTIEKLERVLSSEVVEEVEETNPDDFIEALDILSKVPEFEQIISGLVTGLGINDVVNKFKMNPKDFADRISQIARIPAFIEAIDELKENLTTEFIREHLKVSELYESPSKFAEPNLERSHLAHLEYDPERAGANKVMLALKLALGAEYMNGVYERSPFSIRSAYSHLEIDADKFYKLISEIAVVFGDGPVNVREAISIFKNVFNLTGHFSPPPVFYPDFNTGELVIDSDPFTGRNVILGLPFILERAPIVEELKLLAELDFEVGLCRLENTHEWIIVLGGGGFNEPPTAEEIKELIGEEDNIYIYLHSHSPSLPNPREPSKGDIKVSPGEIRFVISRFGLTLYDETGVKEYIPWEEVTPALYNP